MKHYDDHPCPPPYPQWWGSNDEEYMSLGPFDTAEALIEEAIDSGEYEDEAGDFIQPAHIGLYRKIHIDLSRKFEASRWLEMVGDDFMDEEGPDLDGGRHPLEDLTAQDIKDLEESVRLAIWHWQHRKALTLRSWWLDGPLMEAKP